MAGDARVAGIAGTAKNTGKTTALNALLAEAHRREIPVAVTSIGYDGEAVDNVTALPKPRIVLHPGAVATTARSCIPATGWEVLDSTGSWTALGEVLVVRCLEPGPIVLAGPNRRSDLARVVEQMQVLDPCLTLVDGAMNRLAPMSVASALILATGAARTPDVAALARETAAVESLFRLPCRPEKSAGIRAVVRSPFPSVDDLLEIAGGPPGSSLEFSFAFPVHPDVVVGALHDPRLRDRKVSLTFSCPVLLLLCGDPAAVAAALEGCREHGWEVGVKEAQALAAVTVNPFYPRFEGCGYVADTVPSKTLLAAFRSALRSPVTDVVAEGAEELWEALTRSGYLRRFSSNS